ncbi:LytR/AlgR family response regulator transcription factor [Fibrella aquatilis]|uniref:Response regulator transcription factor n=1 Tax=Fibrella aquatilis TaxID=2817059 RepID=A0A939G362_9BACT|nr:LytTR family DNA-binding domain-containing protein [Fibrella aquatilis]MBO0931497.1 response regulator transcription factor [Fibrella aquatilis]
MTTILIEDEAPAARRLAKLLTQLEPDIQILAQPDTITGAVGALRHNQPDLVFSDIRLADGLSFEAFRQVEVSCPIIFTTAYDEYAIRAFSVNSIDYLLKPIDPEKLAQSLVKFRQLRPTTLPESTTFQALMTRLMQQGEANRPVYRSRFLVSYRDQLTAVPIDDVAYFYSEQKITHLITAGGKLYPVAQTMDELETQLDPQRFFRANRQFMVSVGAIGTIFTHFNGKLKLDLRPATPHEVLVSREKATALKAWLNS